MVRAIAAKALVAYSSAWWDLGYSVFQRSLDDRRFQEADLILNSAAMAVEHVALPAALALDRNAATKQMAKSGWWG